MNLGDDADTTGALYGQTAGAYYGEGDIPKPWRCKFSPTASSSSTSSSAFSGWAYWEGTGERGVVFLIPDAADHSRRSDRAGRRPC